MPPVGPFTGPMEIETVVAHELEPFGCGSEHIIQKGGEYEALKSDTRIVLSVSYLSDLTRDAVTFLKCLDLALD